MQINKTTAALVLVLIFCAIGFALTSKQDFTGYAVKNQTNPLTGFVSLSFGIDPSCDDAHTVLRLFDTSNSHVQTWDGDYTNKICASGASDTTRTCNGNNLIGYVYPGGGHFSESDTTWTQICYGNFKCVRGSYPSGCPAGYNCIISYIYETDSHAGDCNANYDRKVCCKTACGAEKEICNVSSECCNLSTGYIYDQYCSYGINEDLSQGHCCEKGYYWNPLISECTEATECNPSPCPYDSNIPSQYQLLLKDIRCLMRDNQFTDHWDPPYNQCCCHIVRYGQDGFYWCDAKTTGG